MLIFYEAHVPRFQDGVSGTADVEFLIHDIGVRLERGTEVFQLVQRGQRLFNAIQDSSATDLHEP